jgi:hypothetical protein
MNRLVLFHHSTPYLSVFSLISAGYCVTRLLDGFQFVMAGSICLTAAVLFSIIWTITEDRADVALDAGLQFDGASQGFGRSFEFSHTNPPMNIIPVGYHPESSDSDTATAEDEADEANRFDFDNFSDPFLEKNMKEEAKQHDYSKDPARLRMESMRGFKF